MWCVDAHTQTFFAADGVRYRVTAFPDWTVQRVKEALFKGGIAASSPDGMIQQWQDLELIYAGQIMTDNESLLSSYHVPPVCVQTLCLQKYIILPSTNPATSGLPVPHCTGRCSPTQWQASTIFCVLELAQTALLVGINSRCRHAAMLGAKHRWCREDSPLESHILNILLLLCVHTGYVRGSPCATTTLCNDHPDNGLQTSPTHLPHHTAPQNAFHSTSTSNPHSSSPPCTPTAATPPSAQLDFVA